MSEIKFSNQIPPVYARCHAVFGVNWSKGLVITYGDTVYSARDIGPDLVVHESVHVGQQARMGRDAWWDRYFTDVGFRLEQETEAYSARARWIRSNMNRHDRRAALGRIASDMAGMYGGMCSKGEAELILKNA